MMMELVLSRCAHTRTLDATRLVCLSLSPSPPNTNGNPRREAGWCKTARGAGRARRRNQAPPRPAAVPAPVVAGGDGARPFRRRTPGVKAGVAGGDEDVGAARTALAQSLEELSLHGNQVSSLVGFASITSVVVSLTKGLANVV
jgi:hypothetical protein